MKNFTKNIGDIVYVVANFFLELEQDLEISRKYIVRSVLDCFGIGGVQELGDLLLEDL